MRGDARQPLRAKLMRLGDSHGSAHQEVLSGEMQELERRSASRSVHCGAAVDVFVAVDLKRCRDGLVITGCNRSMRFIANAAHIAREERMRFPEDAVAVRRDALVLRTAGEPYHHKVMVAPVTTAARLALW